MRSRAERHTQVRQVEEDIKISADTSQVTVSADLELEAGGEGGVGDGAGGKVKVQDSCCVGGFLSL